MVGRRAHGHQPPRAQGADQYRLVRPLGRQPQVVGKAGRHRGPGPAPGRLAAQEVGLHLQLAVAEQQELDLVAHRPAEILDPARLRHRPIGIGAFLGAQAQPVQGLAGVAPVQRLERLGHLGGLGLGGLVGEHPALHQGRQTSGQGVGIEAVAGQELGHLAGHIARRLEPDEDLGDLGVDHEPELADGVDDQHALGVQRRQMHIGRAADQHGAGLRLASSAARIAPWLTTPG